MSQLVVLNLGKGSCQVGFPAVTVQVWQAEQPAPMQFGGELPPAPDLAALHQRWQRFYQAIYENLGWRRSAEADASSMTAVDSEAFESAFEIDEADVTVVSQAAFDRLSQDVQCHLNQWLNAASFRNIDQKLRTLLSPTDEIRLIVTAASDAVLRLPWQLWQFLDDYPLAELALSPAEYARSIKVTAAQTKRRVRILAVLGDRQGIDVEQDVALLQQLPQVDLTVLVEPNRAELSQQLGQASWDLLFFAGHSSSQGQGQIQVNPSDSLTIDQLRYSLRSAIAHGLKLAIFNSCDGLGLARDLADLHLPQVIVMREPVPDRVAQEFLKQFLAAFSHGRSLYQSVRQAREQLQALETEFPGATWLPVICQNPAEVPPYWRDWCRPPIVLPRLTQRELTRVLLSSVLTTGLITAVRWFGLLQPLELSAFDRLMQLRPAEPPDPRLLIVTVTEQDIQAQGQEPRLGSLSDRTLHQLLQTLESYQPRAIGLDLYRDFPARLPQLQQQMQTSDRLIGICKRPDAKNDPTGILPPPEIPESRVGFSDFVQDADGAIRRHLLVMSPNPTSPCTTAYALSVQLVFRYLDTIGVAPQFTPAGDLQLGQIRLPRLHSRTAGYQPVDARGSQILLNYRAAPSPQMLSQQVSVRQILNRQINPNAVKDRIVLIGLDTPSSGDAWATPYGRSFAQKLPGVVIHAQMVSQLLSAVLDQRPLLWVWNPWVEIAWIGGWATLGGILGWGFRQFAHLSAAIGLAGAALAGLSLALLMHGGWIPLIPAFGSLLLTGSAVRFSLPSSEISL
jgi:CHASE2 domain-containing sensor protein